MKLNVKSIIAPAIVVAVLVAACIFPFRIDLTSDHRYSIAEPTKQLMQNLEEPLAVTVYLDGDLNPGFLRLRRATAELLDELAVHAAQGLKVTFENPSLASSQAEREARYDTLQARGLTPTAVYERDREGRMQRKIIFPWATLHYQGRAAHVNLLKNIRGHSGDENLNTSIENLEFELTDALRTLAEREVKKIAFIEGHGELTEKDTYDLTRALSKYFQIDRGTLGTDADALDGYKAIIIASPQTPLSETDKYIIDQYVMRGGRVLWLVEGVRLAREQLSTTGQSPAIELDVNLKDLLFRYGVRINPVLLQDVQSASVPVNVAPAGEPPHFEQMPWVYAPLLLTSYAHPATRNVAEVRSEFCSSVEPVGEHEGVRVSLLLATSNNTHVLGTPASIDLNTLPDPSDAAYFNTGYVPVAVAVEGTFASAFAHRMPPEGLQGTHPQRAESVPTRQIMIADGDLARNDWTDGEALPLGLDRYTGQQFGNREFLVNAVLYLTDRDGWMNLRSRTVRLTLLNKKACQDDRLMWQIINVGVPIGLLLGFGVVYQVARRKRYGKG